MGGRRDLLGGKMPPKGKREEEVEIKRHKRGDVDDVDSNSTSTRSRAQRWAKAV